MQKIHMRIFFPVLFILIFFPLATFGIFLVSSKQYFHYQAERDLEELSKRIKLTIEEAYSAASVLEQRTDWQEWEYSRILLKNLQDMVQKDNFEAFMIAISSRGELSYPSGDEVAPAVQMLYEELAEGLRTGQLLEGLILEVDTQEGKYLVHMIEIPSQNNIRGKYLIAYIPVTNGLILVSRVGKLLGSITVICFVLSAVVVWLVTGGIAKPLENFCYYTTRIGAGDYQPIRETYSIEEIEKLKNSVNQMVKKLKESEENTRCFFQNVSHDLRTPLTIIGAYAQGIQSGIVKDNSKSAGIILEECKRMMELIESILTISRIDSQALELQRLTIPLQEFIQEQLYIIRESMGEKSLIFYENSAELYIETDPQLLIRIFQNIIFNCLRYAEEKIEISIKSEKDTAIVQIEDDGPGISADILSHAFERFYKGVDGNIGIGLSIVYSGMEYLGGSVTLYNKKTPLHGAVYQLKFPKKQDH